MSSLFFPFGNILDKETPEVRGEYALFQMHTQSIHIFLSVFVVGSISASGQQSFCDHARCYHAMAFALCCSFLYRNTPASGDKDCYISFSFCITHVK